MATTYHQPLSGRRRAIAIGLTVAIHVLIVWLFLSVGPAPLVRMSSNVLATFDVAPEAAKQPDATPSRQPEQQQRRTVARAAPPKAVTPPDTTQVPDFMRLTREQFTATDVSRLTPSTERGDAGESQAGTGDSAAAYGPGGGPGGARLYRAEWVREPTSAELRTYLPATEIGSWGEIACRTIADNRVENCQPLGESPVGSKLATGMRRAAWQFRVRPPRLGGKAMVGEWVRIRIDITDRGVEARR